LALELTAANSPPTTLVAVVLAPEPVTSSRLMLGQRGAEMVLPYLAPKKMTTPLVQPKPTGVSYSPPPPAASMSVELNWREAAASAYGLRKPSRRNGTDLLKHLAGRLGVRAGQIELGLGELLEQAVKRAAGRVPEGARER
jgi:hypothetical protein